MPGIKPTPAGPMRHRIAIQVNTPVQNSLGEAVPAYATAVTVWGRIEALSGRELLLARQVVAQATTQITMRYPGTSLGSAGLTPRHRLVYTPGSPSGAPARTFDINSVINVDERNRTVVCLCTEAK